MRLSSPAAELLLRVTAPPLKVASLVTRVLLAALALTVTALVAVPWQQSASGDGRVVALAAQQRRQRLEAPVDGRVMSWNVAEGTRVKRGDVLVEIVDVDPGVLERLAREQQAQTDRVAALGERITALETRHKALRRSAASAGTGASARSNMARQRMTAQQQAVAAAEASNEVARLNQQRLLALFEKGLVSRRQFELADADAVKARTEYARAEAQLQAALNERGAFEADVGKTINDAQALLEDVSATLASVRADRASAFAELQRVEGRLSRQRAQQVLAPFDGTVLRLSGGVGGEMVKGGELLLELIPDTDERAVEMWIDGNDLPLVREGREVRLQFEGWPAMQFSGWPEAAFGTFAGRVVLVDATDNGAGKFRILVSPSPEPWPSATTLRQGVRVSGWVLLDRVKLGYELWRRLNGFPPVMPAAPSASEESSAREAK